MAECPTVFSVFVKHEHVSRVMQRLIYKRLMAGFNAVTDYHCRSFSDDYRPTNLLLQQQQRVADNGRSSAGRRGLTGGFTSADGRPRCRGGFDDPWLAKNLLLPDQSDEDDDEEDEEEEGGMVQHDVTHDVHDVSVGAFFIF